MDLAAQKVVEKIRKLLALAEGNANAAESAAAAARAAELMERHRITQGMLGAAGDSASPIEERTIFVVDKLAWWRRDLCKILCDHFSVHLMLVRTTKRGARILVVGAGRQEDIEVARIVFAAVVANHMRHYHQDSQARRLIHGGRRPKGWADGFFYGAIQVLGLRLKEMRERVRAEAVSQSGRRATQAIACVDNRLAEARDFMRSRYETQPDAPKERISINPLALELGRMAGAAVDLGAQRKIAAAAAGRER